MAKRADLAAIEEGFGEHHDQDYVQIKLKEGDIYLEDAVNGEMPMTVGFVDPDSAISQISPRLQEGDFVVHINGQHTHGKESSDFHKLFMKGREIKLTIKQASPHLQEGDFVGGQSACGEESSDFPEMLKASKKRREIMLTIKHVDDLTPTEKVQFVKGKVSSSFGETFLEAGNTLGEALLNSKTLTEAHKALTKDTFSFPPTKARALATELASEARVANYAYLQQCYIPLFEVATKRCQFGSLAAIMFQQLKRMFRFHSWADFFSKSKNTSDPFKVANSKMIVSPMIELMDKDDIRGIIKLKPTDLWGGVDVWVLAVKNMAEKHSGRDGEDSKKLTDLLRDLVKLDLDIDTIEKNATYLVKEGANPLEGKPQVVAIVAKKDRRVAETLGKGGVDQLRKNDKLGWIGAETFLSKLMTQHVHQDVVRGILCHTVKGLPVNEKCRRLKDLRIQALKIHYYDVLLELLRVQFDKQTFCKLIEQAVRSEEVKEEVNGKKAKEEVSGKRVKEGVSGKKVKEEVRGKKVKEEDLVVFVKELDLVLSQKDKQSQAKVMHKAAAGGLTTLVEEILVRGDRNMLLQAKHEGALPFQTALKARKYPTAIALLKDKKNMGQPGLWQTEENKKVLQKELSKLLQTLGGQGKGDDEPDIGEDEEEDTDDEEEDSDDSEDGGDSDSDSDDSDKEVVGKREEVDSPEVRHQNDGEKEDVDSPEVRHQNDEEKDDQDVRSKRQEVVSAILDTCFVGDSVDYEILNTEIDGESCYNLIGKYQLNWIQKHECYRTLVSTKWKQYGRKIFTIYFLFFMLFMEVLTAALVLAAESPDPRLYCNGIDWFRLVLEILTVIIITFRSVQGVLELWKMYKRSKDLCRQRLQRAQNREERRGAREEGEEGRGREEWRECTLGHETQPLVRVPPSPPLWRALKKHLWRPLVHCPLWRALKIHFGDWHNCVEVAAVMFTFAIIPCRIADTNWQWRFVALAFILNGLRIFEFTVLWPWIGEYTEILVHVIKEDIPRFAVVFAVVALSLGGGLYFALRGEVSSRANSNSTCSSGAYDIVSETGLGIYPDSTSEIYLTWLLTIRMVAEGSILDYYDEYNWFPIFIYWLTLFSVVVILSSLLIAQFSTTYGDLQKAHSCVTLTRAGILYQMKSDFVAKQLILKCACFKDESGGDMMAKQTSAQFVDSQKEQVQAIDIKVHAVDRNVVNIRNTLRTLTEDMKDMKNTFAEVQQQMLQKIIEQLKAKDPSPVAMVLTTPEEGMMTSKDIPISSLITMEDAIQCCRHIDGDVALFAAALDIPDGSLQEIRSNFKQTQAQALQMIKTWMTSTGGNRDMLISILRGSGFGTAAEVLSG